MVPAHRIRFVAKPAVFVASLTPFGWLALAAFAGRLGPNPIETITHQTGDWTLRFLLLTLAVTPLRALTGWNPIVRFRRMLGLFAFFYACLHVTTYVWLDKFFDWTAIVRDIPRRPFITVGFLAFVVLVPLAATSTAGMIRRLGGRAWQRLHRLIYVAAVAGVVHFWWLVKADITRPRRYAVAVGALLTARLAVAARRAVRETRTGRLTAAASRGGKREAPSGRT
jgi:methionine sulfoxide reductase heme-binding subunit